MLSPAANPPIIFPDKPIVEIPGTWYVGHTKSRFEKTFAWDLQREGIAYFLPMIQRLTFSGGRKRKGMMPLFPGYVFFAGDEQTRVVALTTGRLCQVIPSADQKTLVREMDSLRLALEKKVALDPYPCAVVGRRCRIATGPFEGVEGTVVQRDGQWKLVLQVSMLGQSIAMQVEPGMVEAAE